MNERSELIPCNNNNIIESVDSISRDGPDCPYMKYITKSKISQSMYSFKTSNRHYRNLRVEYYQYT